MKLEDITPWNYHLYRGSDPRVLALCERMRDIERTKPINDATRAQWRICEARGGRPCPPALQRTEESVTGPPSDWPARTEPPSLAELLWWYDYEERDCDE